MRAKASILRGVSQDGRPGAPAEDRAPGRAFGA